MKHLKASFLGKNAAWRYLVMLVTLFLSMNIIGGLVIVVVVAFLMMKGDTFPESMPDNLIDLSVYGVDPITELAIMLFAFLVGAVVFMLLIKPLHGRSLIETINGTSRFRTNRFVVGAAVWLLLSALYLVVVKGLDYQNYQLNNLSWSLLPLIFVALIFIPFQSGLEEVLFRGYFMQGLYRLIPRKWFPLIVTSLIFGLMHGLNPEVKEYGFYVMMPQYILFGLVFGISTLLDDGAEAAMGAHIANNFFLSVMVTNKSSALQTPAVFEQLEYHPWPEFFSLLLISALFLVIMGKRFNWSVGSLKE